LPRVTVIIATYNWSAVLAHSVASVLDQTFADFELLVVGDGCTDDSGDVVTALGDPRVHWHNLPENTGHQSAPNNEGIRMAEGDLIAYLGHDDLWLPNHLEVLVNAIDGGAEIAHGMTLTVTPVGRPQTVPRGGWVYTPVPARMALGRLGVPPVFTSAEGRWRRRRRYKGVDDR
jgi:glycosyltransferase involved in cell wall biosynthesis